jgi:hypothetical protein
LFFGGFPVFGGVKRGYASTALEKKMKNMA